MWGAGQQQGTNQTKTKVFVDSSFDCTPENGGPNRLFDVLRHPPVVLFVKITDGDETRA